MTNTYMQIPPIPYLSNWVKHYLILDVKSNVGKKVRYFSNGHSGIVFVLKKKQFKALNTGNELPETYVFGQISKNHDFLIHGALKVVIVIFQPYGLYGFTGISSKEFEDQILKSNLIFGEDVYELNEKLKLTFLSKEMVEHLNSYFINKLKHKQYATAPFLQSTVQQILSKKGLISVHELVSYSCSSERNLQRIFSHQVGISPKKFIQSVRLHSFLALIIKESNSRYFTDMGLRAGYYDQAHLIREFKKITGLTPSSYRKKPSLAVNLIELQ